MLNIKVLGPGCANCRKLEEIVREARSPPLGVEAVIKIIPAKVTDMGQIAKLAYDVLKTPGLVINEPSWCRRGDHSDRGGTLVFASAVSYALYLMGNGQAVGRLGAARVTAWASTAACVLCLAHFAAVRPLSDLVQPAPVMLLAATMALFSTVLPVWMVSEAIRRLGAGPVSLIGTLGPVVTLFLGWLILAEPIGLFQLIGGALVVAGVMLVGKKG
jgi:drug/metabolite transporter (DMT)-like permease